MRAAWMVVRRSPSSTPIIAMSTKSSTEVNPALLARHGAAPYSLEIFGAAWVFLNIDVSHSPSSGERKTLCSQSDVQVRRDRFAADRELNGRFVPEWFHGFSIDPDLN